MMFRTIVRREASAAAPLAVSVASGSQYPKNKAAEMAKMGFTSNLWITERHMALAGVTVRPDQAGKGFKGNMADGTQYNVYNVSQTSDAAKLEKLKGRLIATSAFTGQELHSDTAAELLKNLGEYPTNEWVTQKHVDGLGLKLKAGASPVTVQATFVDNAKADDGTPAPKERTVDIKYYNVASIENPDFVGQVKKLFPISAATGRRYSTDVAMQLLRVSLSKGYDSPFWLTLSAAQGMGITVKDPKDGVSITLGESKTATFFNACQTNAAAKVASEAYKAQFQPRSAMSGASYPDPTSSELSAASLKNKHKSIYWLTRKQASFLGVEILPGQQPTMVQMGEGTVKLFNADQTNACQELEQKFAKKN